MNSKSRLIILVIIFIIGLVLDWSGLFFSFKIFGQGVDDTDCNLSLKQESQIPENFGFYTRADILQAYANLRTNCPPMAYDDNSEYPQSQYFYEQLVWVGRQKLEGNAEKIGLTSDPSGLALKTLWEKAGASSSEQGISQIPASLQSEYDNIRDLIGSYDLNKAQDYGIYEGSIGLAPKYNALCDLARGIYFNENVTSNKLGSTTATVDRMRLSCLSEIKDKMVSINNTQSAYLSKIQGKVSKDLTEALNTDTHNQLGDITNTLSEASRSFTDISKKIDQSMQNCNPTDV